ncbi:hypothetical protein Droror1_Dr00024881 [Drosera rotundifolia]
MQSAKIQSKPKSAGEWGGAGRWFDGEWGGAGSACWWRTRRWFDAERGGLKLGETAMQFSLSPSEGELSQRIEARLNAAEQKQRKVFDEMSKRGRTRGARRGHLLLPRRNLARGSKPCSTLLSRNGMSDDNPFVIPEMESTLRKQIKECNQQVVNVTTPANYFHVLRCQVCYELDELRQGSSIGDVAICRVEQLCPFPYDLNQRELKRYPSMYTNTKKGFKHLLR